MSRWCDICPSDISPTENINLFSSYDKYYTRNDGGPHSYVFYIHDNIIYYSLSQGSSILMIKLTASLLVVLSISIVLRGK